MSEGYSFSDGGRKESSVGKSWVFWGGDDCRNNGGSWSYWGCLGEIELPQLVRAGASPSHDDFFAESHCERRFVKKDSATCITESANGDK